MVFRRLLIDAFKRSCSQMAGCLRDGQLKPADHYGFLLVDPFFGAMPLSITDLPDASQQDDTHGDLAIPVSGAPTQFDWSNQSFQTPLCSEIPHVPFHRPRPTTYRR